MWTFGKDWITAALIIVSVGSASSATAQEIDTSNWSNKSLTTLILKPAAAKTSDAALPDTALMARDTGLTISGRVLAIDRDSGCLIQDAKGTLKWIMWNEVASAQQSEEMFEPVTVQELAKQLTPASSDVKALTSEHYVVLYRGPPAYAQWIISMYERLYRGFYSYWKGIGVELKEPEFPLIVNVFSNKNGYLLQAERDRLDAANSMIGYYHLHTNQTVSYDLTESQQLPGAQNVGKRTLLNIIRSQPGWERTVATIVHESVHQLAYNSGLQVRLADNPLWLSEGIAMYFESPDLNSSRGWSGIGNVNQYQLAALKTVGGDLSSRDWITPLVQDDELFTDGATVNAAYAQSWALTFFLIKAKQKEFAAYMKEIGQEQPFAPTDPKRRMTMFQSHFGDDVFTLQKELVRKLSRLQ